MTVTRRHVLQQGGLVLLMGAAELARGAGIVAVRVWPAQDYTRVTVMPEGPCLRVCWPAR